MPALLWMAGASFELVELQVFAGDRIAYAYALLRCGTDKEFAADPDKRLRLTLGLQKNEGKWQVAHEHHSFTIDG